MNKNTFTTRKLAKGEMNVYDFGGEMCIRDSLYGVAALLGFCAVLITADSFVKAMMIIGVAFVFILLGAFVLYRREKKAEKEPQQEDSSEQN